MPGHYNMKNKDLAASAKYGTPMQKNYGAGPKMYNSPADMHPGHPAKMNSPHHMGGKNPVPPMEPAEKPTAPGKFTAELVKEANDPNSGMNDKFKAIVKKAGSKDKS
tara:strand:- start:699 stop:1019 length:321 start_codon:yes stop_codon:yes gene_type:complete